jgi:hypothetical protein
MGWSSGVYSKGNSATGGWTGDAASGIGIEAGRHDTQDNDFATGINTCLTKDGQNTPTANLPMGGFKHTGVANGSANTDYMAYGQIRNGTPLYMDTTNNRLGINTSTPACDLDVLGTTARLQVTRFSADTAAPQIDLQKSRGATLATNTIVQSGDILGVVRFNGANGTNYSEAAYIAGWCDGTPGATNDMPGRITFATTADGSGVATERIRITSSGLVGINNNAPNSYLSINTDGSADDFSVGRDITGAKFIVSKRMYDTTTVAGANVAIESTGGSYPIRRSTSSIKYKKDVVDLDPIYADKLHQFRPVFYKSKCFSDNPQFTHYGFIAEELAQIEPRFVQFGYQESDYEVFKYTDSDGKEQVGKRLKADAKGEPEGVSYDRIVTFLTSVVQRQEKRIAALETRIAELEK